MTILFNRYIACLLFLCLLIACNTETSQSSKSTPPVDKKSNTGTPPPPPPNASTFDTTGFISTDIPVIANEKLQAAFEKANLMDIIFYNMPMSINQNDPGQIKSTLGLISPNKPKFKGTCTPLGRMFFYNGADTMLEAEIYYGGTCYYYKFYENGEVIGNNNMNMQGVNFFANIIKQGESQMQGR